MQDLVSFYQKLLEGHHRDLTELKKKLAVSSGLRLLVFLVTLGLVYLFFGNIKLVLAIAIIGIGVFLFLVSRHTDLQHRRDRSLALQEINNTEIRMLHRDFEGLPTGDEFRDPRHHFSQDIDLFGKGSFYQYANRTKLEQGSLTLANLLTENAITDIAKKQEAVKELSQMPEWCQTFSAVASLVKTRTSTDSVEHGLHRYQAFVPVAMKYAPPVFSAVSLLSFLLYFLGGLPVATLLLLLVLGLLVSGFYAKKITKLGHAVSAMQSTFEQYNQLLQIIERTEFDARLLQEKKQRIIREGKKTSLILRDFSKLLGNLDQNNNVFYLIFGNGYFLRALSTSYRIEQWIARFGPDVKDWFAVIAFFDAYISLGTFSFNHPEYAFPTLGKGEVVLRSEAAGHPLLHPEKSVRNDFKIDSDQFFIITGANMAGKSTFLRTVSLQIMMANVGLPICAKAAEYTPIKLITSMRTTDSLANDESYFFSELKRLKFIVDAIRQDRYFIVLDEILKGTNSTDKAKGSRKFVEKLVASQSTGIIATHDLSLCEVAKELPQVSNYYFDAEIVANELHFDYRFKKGICQNMNASFLLKKMDIVN